ncbi:hypothetical protein IX51_04230 [uncultured archaeon]|nr:hypothetical protein IX51_04230 [uncultured archaeon]HKJ97150.1 CDP-2,3-bis-(O-geranylgeranyl)-sn-glycerol synthase [Thermoplasmataceae archaeon]
MLNLAKDIIDAFILFLPAFTANPGAVVTGGYGKVDFGRNFIDGRRIFGDGKTWSGFFGGSLIGVAVGVILFFITSIPPLGYFGTFGPSVAATLVVVIPMSFGSLLGDMAGSFVKRRLGLKSGDKGFLLDQWPFALVSFLLVYIFATEFFMNYYGNIVGALAILFITPPLHRAINVIGYKLNKKDVPW